MIRPLLFTILLILCVAVSGCSEKTTDTAQTRGSHDDHDHAMAKPAGFNQNVDFAINYDDNFHSHGVGRFGGLLAVLGRHQYHVEFIPNKETGDVLAILYDNRFKPFKTATKELTLSLKVDDQPKQYTIPVDFEGSEAKPALYKINDGVLAKLLHDGWTGDALVTITVDGQSASGPMGARK